MADAKPEQIQDLLGGGLFKALYTWMLESGPVYLLPTGVLVVSGGGGDSWACVGGLMEAPGALQLGAGVGAGVRHAHS